MEDPPEKQKSEMPEELQKVRAIDSGKLLQGQNMLLIRHAGEDYRLILTRNNRLILQK